MSQAQTRTIEQILDLAKDLAILEALSMDIDCATVKEQDRWTLVAGRMLAVVEGAELDNATVLKYLENKYLGQ